MRPGHTYLFRYAHKADHVGDDTPAMFHVRQLDAKDQFVLGQVNIELPCGTYDWKEETHTISIADGVSTLEILFHHPGGRGRTWLSEPSLAEVSEQPTEAVAGQWAYGQDGCLHFTGLLPGTEVRLLARAQEGDDAVAFDTALSAPSGWLLSHPQAFVLGFRLPVTATGWKWGDYIRGERTIEAGADYRNYHICGMRQMRLASWFPMAAISGPEQGLALTAPLAPATYNRFSYAGRGALEAEFDLGLAARAAKPSAQTMETTRISFSLLRYQPAWGYRAALAAYYKRYPQFFVTAPKEGGWWLGDNAPIKNLTDFGMQFAENHFADPRRAKPLNDEGIYVCSYCEPWMWRVEDRWIEANSIHATKPLPYYLAKLEEQADLPPSVMDSGDYFAATRRDSVRAFLNSAVYGPDGKIVVNQIRSYGPPTIEFLTSPLPGLGNEKWGSASRGLLSYNMETLADAKRCEAGGTKTDGVYFDSLGDWADVSTEDHRTEHFRFSTSPLTFSYATGTPVISGLAAMTEYMQFIKDKKLVTMGNSGAEYAAYVAPYLDYVGAGEGYDDSFDTGDVATDRTLSFDRTAAYHKTVGFLNTGMTQLAPDGRREALPPAPLLSHLPRPQQRRRGTTQEGPAPLQEVHPLDASHGRRGLGAGDRCDGARFGGVGGALRPHQRWRRLLRSAQFHRGEEDRGLDGGLHVLRLPASHFGVGGGNDRRPCPPGFSGNGEGDDLRGRSGKRHGCRSA